MFKQGVALNPEAVCKAAYSGRIHILKWLAKKGISLQDPNLAVLATQERYWEILKFLITHGCKFHILAWEKVQEYGNERLVKWVAEKWELQVPEKSAGV